MVIYNRDIYTVNGNNDTVREYLLDHIYVTDPNRITNLQSNKPLFGDHLCVMFEIDGVFEKPETIYKRDWRKYTKESLCNELMKHDWSFDDETVQGYWIVLW